MPEASKPENKKERYKAGQTREDGRTICGAKTRSGNPCTQTIITDNGRCRMHGGTTPIGAASPHYKDGRYSRIFAKIGTRGKFEQAIADPTLLELNRDIALIDSRTEELLDLLYTSEEPVPQWKEIADAWIDFRAAVASRNADKQREEADRIEQIINRGKRDEDSWGEIYRSLEVRRRLAESERKRRIDAQLMITADQALSFANHMTSIFLGALLRHVTDPAIVSRVRSETSEALKRVALS